MLTLLILCSFISSVDAISFWTTTQIHNFTLDDNCIQETSTCSNPRFQLSLKMLSFNLVHQYNWDLKDEFTDRFLLSTWKEGYTDGVLVYSQIVGNDSVYGIPRVCDHTMAVRPFPPKIIQNSSSLEVEEDVEERTVTLTAKCFNITLLVTKYTGECPFCEEAKATAARMEKNKEGNFVVIVIYVLLFTILLFSAGSIVLFVKLEKRPENASKSEQKSRSSTRMLGSPTVSEMSQNSSPTRSLPIPPSYILNMSPTIPSEDEEGYEDLHDLFGISVR